TTWPRCSSTISTSVACFNGLARRWVGRLPARRNANVGHTEEPLDAGPLADVVALGAVADVLQKIADDECRGAPEPFRVEPHGDAAEGQRDADHVDPEVEGQLMALFP